MMISNPSAAFSRRARTTVLVLLSCLILPAAIAQTAFTYQGRLSTGGQPAQGAHDVEFRLFDAATNGNQVGSTLTENGLTVTDGVFSAVLDFGDEPFNSAPRWIQLDVRASGGGAFTTLLPRLQIGAAPFAIESQFVAPGAIDTAALQDNSVTTGKIANGNVFTDDLANFAVGTGKLSNQAVTEAKIAVGAVTSAAIANGSIERVDLSDNLIGSSQIENGSVASVDIRDGTITAADVAGGLYSNKTALYEVLSPIQDVGASPLSEHAACLDANDLPIWGGCRPMVQRSLIAVSAQRIDWSSPSNPASVSCSAVNLTPTNPGMNRVEFQAHMICLAVP